MVNRIMNKCLKEERTQHELDNILENESRKRKHIRRNNPLIMSLKPDIGWHPQSQRLLEQSEQPITAPQ